MVSAHAMHAASRRCRRGAKVEAFDRSLIRVETQNRTSEELLEVIGSSSDVSAHEICIRVFKLRRVFVILIPANEKSKIMALGNLSATPAARVWTAKAFQRVPQAFHKNQRQLV